MGVVKHPIKQMKSFQQAEVGTNAHIITQGLHLYIWKSKSETVNDLLQQVHLFHSHSHVITQSTHIHHFINHSMCQTDYHSLANIRAHDRTLTAPTLLVLYYYKCWYRCALFVCNLTERAFNWQDLLKQLICYNLYNNMW